MIIPAKPRELGTKIHWTHKLSSWTIERRRSCLFPSELYEANYFIGISLKSKEFSRDWLTSVVDAIEHLRGSAYLCLVDKPYLSTMRKDMSSSILFEKLCGERNDFIQRIASKYPCTCKIVCWEDIEREVDLRISQELRSAFIDRNHVFELINSQTRKAIGSQQTSEIVTQSSEFLLNEIPTLIWIYYCKYPGLIDVYPSENANLLWQLDLLELTNELPFSSAIARKSRPLTYAHVNLKDLESNVEICKIK